MLAFSRWDLVGLLFVAIGLFELGWLQRIVRAERRRHRLARPLPAPAQAARRAHEQALALARQRQQLSRPGRLLTQATSGSYLTSATFSSLALLSETRRVERKLPPVEPLAAPIVAARAWRLMPVQGGLLLGSVGMGLVWWKRELTAHCHQFGYSSYPDGGEHEAPHQSCRCGIYGLKEPAGLVFRSVNAPGIVLGTVLLWGRVFEHAHGYRAQHARIMRLILAPGADPRVADQLVRRYQCELSYEPRRAL